MAALHQAASPPAARVTGTSDSIFSTVETMHARHRPTAAAGGWGSFLDAGTGAHSLQWVRQLPVASWTAVTADPGMQKTVEAEAEKNRSDPSTRVADGNIVLGNWDDPTLLQGQHFDVLLADYLIGAMDGFSPFTQELVFERLKPHLAHNGMVYIIGLEPIPYHAEYPASLFVEVTRLRDACILLAGHRCYREYPMNWVVRTLQRSGLRVLETKRLPILYTAAAVKRQLAVAERKIKFFKDEGVARAMRAHIEELGGRVEQACAAAPDRRIRIGFDYIVAAELMDPTAGPALAPAEAAATACGMGGPGTTDGVPDVGTSEGTVEGA